MLFGGTQLSTLQLRVSVYFIHTCLCYIVSKAAQKVVIITCSSDVPYKVFCIQAYLEEESLILYRLIGFFSAITIVITWTINNQDSDSKKGTGVAMLNIIGQLGPLIGTHLYPESDGPYYVKGMSVCAGFMMAVGVLSLTLRYVLAMKNKHLGEEYEPVPDEDESLVIRRRKGNSRRFEYIL